MARITNLERTRLDRAPEVEKAYFLQLLRMVQIAQSGEPLVVGMALMVAGDTGYSEAAVGETLNGSRYNPRIIQAAFYEMIDYLDKHKPHVAKRLLDSTESLRAEYGVWRAAWDKTQPIGTRMALGENKAVPVWPEDREKVVHRVSLRFRD
jgi:hypothetical protein